MGAGRRGSWRAAGPLLLLLGAGATLPGVAASPKSTAGPSAAVPTYRIEATTSSGLGAMAAGGLNMMQLMMGGRPSLGGSRRQLDLWLHSPRVVSGPTAEHRIPANLGMGTALPLKSSVEEPGAERRPREKDVEIPEAKGRLLLYRGCAETAAAGQPEIISLQTLPEQRRRALEGLRSLASLPWARGGTGTTGRWPDGGDAPAVPLEGSLVGTHVVTSNYAPEIRFQVDSAHDFLAPVKLKSTAAEGAQRLSWQVIPTALGYQAMATGMGRQAGDIVMWTSSEAPWAESSVPGDLRAPEAARLVQRRVILAPERTSCSVSAQAMAAMQTAMLTFTAYGDTLMLGSPSGAAPWRLSLERRSTAILPLGPGMEMFNQGGGDGKEEAPKREGGFNLFKLF
ncbi:MAG: hypothetical protein ER33_02805 [Cyanobium sp. CACIAM 14]|nr:MAG: hypothetical protein ER33_02805 [Cyanobium sp. CACIAM 14]